MPTSSIVITTDKIPLHWWYTKKRGHTAKAFQCSLKGAVYYHAYRHHPVTLMHAHAFHAALAFSRFHFLLASARRLSFRVSWWEWWYRCIANIAATTGMYHLPHTARQRFLFMWYNHALYCRRAGTICFIYRRCLHHILLCQIFRRWYTWHTYEKQTW